MTAFSVPSLLASDGAARVVLRSRIDSMSKDVRAPNLICSARPVWGAGAERLGHDVTWMYLQMRLRIRALPTVKHYRRLNGPVPHFSRHSIIAIGVFT